MSKDEMKEIVYEYIDRRQHVTYAELEYLFKENGFDYKGNLAQGIKQNPHVIFWLGWNDEAIDIIWELEDEGRIHKVASSWIYYLIDGCAPTLPVVKSDRIYKTDHWCPVAFSTIKKEE